MNNKVASLLNEQIQKELFSAYLYFDIANYYNDVGLDGFSNWFYIQAQEEMSHAILFRQYLLDNGQKVTLFPIDAPDCKFKDKEYDKPLKTTYSHEQKVTASINNIYEKAADDKDYRTTEFLNWFIKEQGEEEKNAEDLIKKFKLFGSDAKALYELDNDLAQRVYTPPSLAET